MRWLVPSAAASPRRLRLPTPCSATCSIAAASSRSRAPAPSSVPGMTPMLALARTTWYMKYHSVHLSPRHQEHTTMARQHIEHRATTTADPATVYTLLRDGATWPAWGPIDSVELEREGAGEREGVGAVRVLRSGRVTGRDTIAELVEHRRFAYTHESSLPVKDYRGAVDLEPLADGGTAIRWVSEFSPKVPGTGALVRRALDRFIAKLVNGLAACATTDAAARGRDAAYRVSRSRI